MQISNNNNVSFSSRILPCNQLRKAITEIGQSTDKTAKRTGDRLCRSLDALINDGRNDVYEFVVTPGNKQMLIPDRLHFIKHTPTFERTHKLADADSPNTSVYIDDGFSVADSVSWLVEKQIEHQKINADLNSPFFLKWKDVRSRLQELKTRIFGE